MDVHEQCLDEIVSGIRGLKLPVPADEIQKRRGALQQNGDKTFTPFKGISVYPIQENQAPGTFSREDIGYGCGVMIYFGADHSYSANVGKLLECRAKIRRKFIHQRLTTPTLSGGYYLQTKVSHLPINTPREAHRYEASSLLIRCWMREPRG